MEKTLKVFDVCGPYCIDEDDVKLLAAKIEGLLNDNKSVKLDFEKVDTVLTAFFNSLFAELFELFDYETIAHKISFVENTQDSIRDKYQSSLSNAITFYKSPKNIQEQIKKNARIIFREVQA